MDGLKIMTDKTGKLSSPFWYARFTRNGAKCNVRIAPKIKINGTPPVDASGRINLKLKGDELFEKSRKSALLALKKMRSMAKTTGKSKAVKDAETADLVSRFYQARTGKTIESPRLDSLPDLWRGLSREKTPTEQRNQISDATFKQFEKFAKAYCANNGGSCATVDEITPEIASAWFSEIRSKYAWGTVKDKWQLLRRAWVRWHIHANKNPFENVVVRNGSTGNTKVERRPLTETELARLFEATKENTTLHNLVVTAACTGMRIGDVCCLKWDDIDLRNGFIDTVTAKAGVRVTVPIFPPLLKVLKDIDTTRAVGDSPFVFPRIASQYKHTNAKGLPDQRTGIIRMVKPYFARAVFPDEEPTPATLLEVKPKTPDEVFAEIDGARFTPAKKERIREIYSRHVNGEKCAEIATALGIARGQVSDYLKELERVTGETYRPRIERKRARGGTASRDLIDRTRAPREIGRVSASLYGWHNLRHTFVVLALEAGIPVNDVSRIVGHGDVETTLNNYGNSSREIVAERTRKRMQGTVLAVGDATPAPALVSVHTKKSVPTTAPVPAHNTTKEKLRELKSLADEGLITEEEYAEQKSIILRSMIQA